jgi:RimJ/RimL family protein N-acetyltransferase
MVEMNITIRRAEESDWRDLRFLRLKALRSDASVFGSSHEKESAMSEADWKSWLQTNDIAIFLLYDDRVPMGLTGIALDRDDPTKKRAVLWGSWLEPYARGKGLSRLMYQRRIEWAQYHPTIEDIIVSHRASNLSSKHANQKHGFRFTHAELTTWPDGAQEENVFYSLRAKPTL